MTDQEMIDKAVEAAVAACTAVFQTNATIPSANRKVADTYALGRALAAVIVHGLGKRRPTPAEMVTITESIRLHCDVVADAMKAGTMQRWH